jgi:hypothetical protein
MNMAKRIQNGIGRIVAERSRQIYGEHWTAEHDDAHVDGELALAACCYAAPRPLYIQRENGRLADPWPEGWLAEWDKRPRTIDDALVAPTAEERIRMLEKAGALIAAEIDRLLREARRRASDPEKGGQR